MTQKKEVLDLQAQIKQQVAALQDSLGDKTITITKKGQFRVGTSEGGDSIGVVILAFVFNGAFWPGAYRQGQTELPDCSVTGDVDTKYADTANPPYVGAFTDLVPRGKDADTEAQAETCGECPMNEFGSGPSGTGKACKQSYTLAVLPGDDPKGHIHKLRISASGMKHFNNYLKDIASAGTTWWANVTTLQVAEAGAQWTVKTLSDGVKPLSNDQLLAFHARVAEAKKMLEYKAPEQAQEVAASAAS